MRPPSHLKCLDERAPRNPCPVDGGSALQMEGAPAGARTGLRIGIHGCFSWVTVQNLPMPPATQAPLSGNRAARRRAVFASSLLALAGLSQRRAEFSQARLRIASGFWRAWRCHWDGMRIRRYRQNKKPRRLHSRPLCRLEIGTKKPAALSGLPVSQKATRAASASPGQGFISPE